MSLLLTQDRWAQRAIEIGGELAPLADGIARDLEPVLARPLYIPAEKALLSREGGRCPRDGTLLEFDPFDAEHHRCAVCGAVYGGDYHRGAWRYWYHLWLAERAVHAAVLFRLRGDERHAEFARAVLDGYVDRYDAYPNSDNVLGPSRPFFSTYLESIWLLQLCVVLDTLESAGGRGIAASAARARERLVAPSARLIASYDEGISNRQVWNVAAQMAAARVLGRADEVQRLVDAPHGLAFLLGQGLLADGTWYEGENYHLFAHRGLWYGVTIAEQAGAALPPSLVARFDAGFLAPFLTALPDMTLPSRRDSQYAISLRQPRFAEPCELGLGRVDDPALRGVLAALYHAPPDVPMRSNGRAVTSADVERNLPAMRLDRSDLGWRALLFAPPVLPPADPMLPGSVLLEGQGIAVLRREKGRVYVGLDYGHSGGGHGHPDRLNLLLMDGDTRWLDDMGTGSYVERTLHWYRSTLAHNAPLVDGRSQRRVDGVLLAYEDRGGAGWVRAEAALAPGVRAVRTVVVMPDYLIDEVRWEADRDVTLDLPMHAPLDVVGGELLRPGELTGGDGLEDGFDFVSDAAWRPLTPGDIVTLGRRNGDSVPHDADMHAFVAVDVDAALWQLTAPGAPGKGAHRFHLMRGRGRSGRIRAVWRWSAGAARAVTLDADAIPIEHADDLVDIHTDVPAGWRIELRAGGARSSIDLGGLRERPEVPAPSVVGARPPSTVPARGTPTAPGVPLHFELGEREYRRSEQSWAEAGRPRATGRIAAAGGHVQLTVHVEKSHPLVFVPEGAENPLDNEPPEINADGVQLYLHTGARAGAWTIVPVPESEEARGVPVRGWAGLELVHARWSVTERGYELTAHVDVAHLEPGETLVHVGVIVNEIVPGRARRRGQLVLGGAEGEWIYLRGDRHDPARLLPILLRASDFS
ncbi:MAG TPA: heparinase II/III family protein [Gemmatimonadaceae bacterium]|nr:heparinase II/III family protein [Gemmatimonadaceae bacterium]